MRWVTELIFKNQTIHTFLEENTEKGLHNLSEGKYLKAKEIIINKKMISWT